DLTDVERTVIEHRFGLETADGEKPMTLEQVGQIIGVTKERVRQIQNKAMEKIRLELESKFLGVKPPEVPGAEGEIAGLPGVPGVPGTIVGPGIPGPGQTPPPGSPHEDYEEMLALN
ncbi:MAG TPA: sigma factor-like helix-turn-helix DNA-binding protein, partial [Phycisphaerales bacterium]|nr:sigma factor-like helix-turn-helix DNA-binding protein [Phycisphaerales bacterium]